MKLTVFSLLSLTIISTRSASAAYFDQYSGTDCTGTVVQTTSLNPDQNQCYEQLGSAASLFVSTDAFPCTFTLFTDSDGPDGCSFGSVTGVLNNTVDAEGCINFYGTGEFILGVCGGAS